MNLPEWLDPLYTPDEMRAADGFAMEQRGILELELAEKAGAGLASAVETAARTGPIRIVVGPGNNGGDGLIAARLLRERGHEVDVLAPLPLEGLEVCRASTSTGSPEKRRSRSTSRFFAAAGS